MITITKKYNWYVVRTQHQHEKNVERELQLKGIQVFCPKITVLKRYNGRKRWIEKPLFGMYVFVFISCIEYFEVHNLPSVIEFIKREGVPDIVPAKQVEVLQFIQDRNIPHEVVCGSLKQSQKIKFMNGPLIGAEGIICKMAGKKKVVIEFENINHRINCNVSDLSSYSNEVTQES